MDLRHDFTDVFFNLRSVLRFCLVPLQIRSLNPPFSEISASETSSFLAGKPKGISMSGQENSAVSRLEESLSGEAYMLLPVQLSCYRLSKHSW